MQSMMMCMVATNKSYEVLFVAGAAACAVMALFFISGEARGRKKRPFLIY